VRKVSIHGKASLLRDFILGASDGIVTTFAVIAGVVGASLSSRVVIILGLAKLLADAISMFAGIYLGAKSEIEYRHLRKDKHEDVHPLTQGIIVFVSFLTIGFLPLLPFVFNLPQKFILSSIIVAIALLVVGGVRAASVGKRALVGAIEMFLIGGAAAVAAYFVGFLLDKYVV
jgi:VIT1/CCC1 family predicted Fe2+/Mn2+ transporter